MPIDQYGRTVDAYGRPVAKDQSRMTNPYGSWLGSPQERIDYTHAYGTGQPVDIAASPFAGWSPEDSLQPGYGPQVSSLPGSLLGDTVTAAATGGLPTAGSYAPQQTDISTMPMSAPAGPFAAAPPTRTMAVQPRTAPSYPSAIGPATLDQQPQGPIMQGRAVPQQGLLGNPLATGIMSPDAFGAPPANATVNTVTPARPTGMWGSLLSNTETVNDVPAPASMRGFTAQPQEAIGPLRVTVTPQQQPLNQPMAAPYATAIANPALDNWGALAPAAPAVPANPLTGAPVPSFSSAPPAAPQAAPAAPTAAPAPMNAPLPPSRPFGIGPLAPAGTPLPTARPPGPYPQQYASPLPTANPQFNMDAFNPISPPDLSFGYGAPQTINPAGDISVQSMGPGYAGPLGINTGGITGTAGMPPAMSSTSGYLGQLAQMAAQDPTLSNNMGIGPVPGMTQGPQYNDNTLSVAPGPGNFGALGIGGGIGFSSPSSTPAANFGGYGALGGGIGTARPGYAGPYGPADSYGGFGNPYGGFGNPLGVGSNPFGGDVGIGSAGFGPDGTGGLAGGYGSDGGYSSGGYGGGSYGGTAGDTDSDGSYGGGYGDNDNADGGSFW